MAPSPLTSLIIRVITFVLLFISIIILCTNSLTVNGTKLLFNDVITYRYTLFTIVMEMAYTLLQSAFTIYHIKMGKRLVGDGLLKFDFYGDKIISYTLVTGAAAAFGASVDLQEVLRVTSAAFDKFFEMGYASASLLLFGFFCSAISSIFSSYSLPKLD